MDAKLVWTDAKPTVPGMWLWRFNKIASRITWELFVAIRDYSNGEIVRVNENGKQSRWPDGQFAGPIPQPEEPHADPR